MNGVECAYYSRNEHRGHRHAASREIAGQANPLGVRFLVSRMKDRREISIKIGFNRLRVHPGTLGRFWLQPFNVGEKGFRRIRLASITGGLKFSRKYLFGGDHRGLIYVVVAFALQFASARSKFLHRILARSLRQSEFAHKPACNILFKKPR
jgi:hypothetical protein